MFLLFQWKFQIGMVGRAAMISMEVSNRYGGSSCPDLPGPQGWRFPGGRWPYWQAGERALTRMHLV